MSNSRALVAAGAPCGGYQIQADALTPMNRQITVTDTERCPKTGRDTPFLATLLREAE